MFDAEGERAAFDQIREEEEKGHVEEGRRDELVGHCRLERAQQRPRAEPNRVPQTKTRSYEFGLKSLLGTLKNDVNAHKSPEKKSKY